MLLDQSSDFPLSVKHVWNKTDLQNSPKILSTWGLSDPELIWGGSIYKLKSSPLLSCGDLKLASLGSLLVFFGHKTFIRRLVSVVSVSRVTSPGRSPSHQCPSTDDGWIASKCEGCSTSLVSFVKNHNPLVWAISSPSPNLRQIWFD